MLYDEFLIGTKKVHNIQMQYAFEVINEMYMRNELDTKEDCYFYFKKNEKKVLVLSLQKANSAFLVARGTIHRELCEVLAKFNKIENEIATTSHNAKFFYESENKSSDIDRMKRIQTEMNSVDKLKIIADQCKMQKDILQKFLDGLPCIGFYR